MNEKINIKEILGITKDNFYEKGLNENSVCSVNIFILSPDIIPKLKKF